LNGTVEIIAREINMRGVISFARFMKLALYCPDYGYYEKEEDKTGRRGDFFTSVSVGSLFGELLAFQFADWIEELQCANFKVRIVEAGAHDGRLAKDILLWLREYRPKIFNPIEYCIVEPSLRRQRWQKQTLREFDSKVRYVSEPGNLDDGVCGIMFSNELLDAMPVHRLGWDAKNKIWFEWGVMLAGDKFVWARMPELTISNSKFQPPSLPAELLKILPDGFTTEISPAAAQWWRDAAQTLRRGKLLAIDYGLMAEEFFTPERSEGTLRGYYRHHLIFDLLANPGEQDLTAQVNFTVIQNVGESAGLKTETFIPQSGFLAQIAKQTTKNSTGFGPWDSARARQFQTLTHPEHLRRAFRVLIQSR
jgi:SAM-dependent MidA family methyltransferase